MRASPVIHPAVVRSVVTAAGVAFSLLALSVAVPLIPQGGDTVPGRLGMVTLACSSTSDISRIEWLRASALAGRTPYHTLPSSDYRTLVSAFGPGPSYLGWALFQPPDLGALVTDEHLRQQARRAAAVAVALAGVLLYLALLSRTTWRWAVGGAMAAGCSFAGFATLGQGLWQQTAALPWLMAGLASAAWTERQPWLLAPAALFATVAATLRPPDALLCVAVLVFALVMARRGGASPLVLLVAGIGSVLGVLPMTAWNIWYFDTILPLGQMAANARFAQNVLVLSPEHLSVSLPGLLFSPARGILWFAPVWLLGCYPRLRADLPLAVGIMAELLVAAAFHKWWGGLAYGPRLLGLSLWVAIFVAVSRLGDRRVLVLSTLALTVLIGLFGAVRYDPRRWEIPNDPDQNPASVWQVLDSPLVAMFAFSSPSSEFRDAPDGPFRYCPPGGEGALVTPREP